MMKMNQATLMVVAVVVVVGLSGVAAQPIGPACSLPNANPFCCHGSFVNGVCECWGDQYFGPNCNYNCRLHLCNTHGVCDAQSNPVVDAQGAIVSGVCVCDNTAYTGDFCQASSSTPTCTDNIKNGAETDVDCGGNSCPKRCKGGQKCLINGDCVSNSCTNGICNDATCTDGIQNNGETDVDCGGPNGCDRCDNGETCLANSDCASGNCQSGHCEGDDTPPQWTLGYPAIGDITDTGARFAFAINEPGRVWMVLKAFNSAAPTVNQVIAGSGMYAANFGVTVPNQHKEAAVGVVLQKGTNYDLYFVAADDRSPPNYQTQVTKLTFKTSGTDVFPPNFWLLSPTVVSVGDTKATIGATLNEPGKVFYAIVPTGTTAPPASTIRSGMPGAVTTGSWVVSTAFTQVTTVVNGLQPDTTYDVLIAAEDVGARLLNFVFTRTFTTTGDATPPQWVNPFPRIANTQSGGFDVQGQITEQGWMFVIVLPKGGAAPSSLQVVQGIDGSGTAALAASSTRITAASTTFSSSLIDLADDTEFDVWVVAADVAVNVQLTPVMLTVRTSVDTIMPTVLSPYPSVKDIRGSSFGWEIQLNEPGVCYGVVTPAGATAPTASQVIAGYTGVAVATTLIQVSRSTTTYEAVVVGLQPSTAYKLYVSCVDDTTPTPNGPTAVQNRDVTTTAGGDAPVFINPTPEFKNVLSTSAVLNVALNEPGLVHYIVLTPDDLNGAPTTANIKAGSSGATGRTVIASGSIAVGAALNEVQKTISGLSASTDYSVYLVTENTGQTVLGTLTLVPLSTIAEGDLTPPQYLTGYPVVHSISETTAQLAVRLDEAGQFFYVVVPAGAASPNNNQILLGHNSGDVAAVASGSNVVLLVGTTYTSFFGGLTADTLYDLYVVTRDNQYPNPNLGNKAKITFRTLINSGSCNDGVKNNAETDVDCGGPTCSKCGGGKDCNENNDCQSALCQSGTCADTCANGVKDGSETDVDCGGGCSKCADGQDCILNSDCVSDNCNSGICEPSNVCTPCAADENTIVSCSSGNSAVCAVKKPVINTDLTTTTKNVVTISTPTSNSYIVATRNCVTPTCNMVSTASTFDDGQQAQVIRTDTGVSATFNLFESTLVKAIACRGDLQSSTVTESLQRVNNKDPVVVETITLRWRAAGNFNSVRQTNFVSILAQLLGVDASKVTILSFAADPASPSDQTNVVVQISYGGSTTSAASSTCSGLKSTLANIIADGTLRSSLLSADVIYDQNGGGGGTGGNQAGQETAGGATSPLFDFSGFGWLWWLIPLLLILLLCCLLICCLLRKREKEYRQPVPMSIVPDGRGAQQFRNSSSEEEEMLEDAPVVDDGPMVKRSGVQRVDMETYGADGGPGAAVSGEATVDLTSLVMAGEEITTTIEGKGNQAFVYEGEQTVTVEGTYSDSDEDGQVGIEDLNALNVRALSFSRMAPGQSSYKSLSRHTSSQASEASKSSLRIWNE